MKSWVFWVCTVVGAYLIYQSWFEPDQESETQNNSDAIATENGSPAGAGRESSGTGGASGMGSSETPRGGAVDPMARLRVDTGDEAGAPGATPEFSNAGGGMRISISETKGTT